MPRIRPDAPSTQAMARPHAHIDSKPRWSKLQPALLRAELRHHHGDHHTGTSAPQLVIRTNTAGIPDPTFTICRHNKSFIDGSATTASNATAGPSFYNTAYYWLKNVVINEMGSIGAYTLQTIHGDIESNYFYGIGKNNSNADPSGINYTGSNNLFVNNIFQIPRLDLLAMVQTTAT